MEARCHAIIVVRWFIARNIALHIASISFVILSVSEHSVIKKVMKHANVFTVEKNLQ